VVPALTARDPAPVCAVGDLEPGDKLLVRRGRREVVLCRAADGRFYAVGNVCPHQGAALVHGTLGGTAVADGVGRYRYARDGEVLRCPWHGWEFDVKTGRALFGEDTARVATYAVAVQDGAVFVADSATKTRQTTESEDNQ
jgi:nitrite reductase/ring-hydroxylating ferredoxin subunit